MWVSRLKKDEIKYSDYEAYDPRTASGNTEAHRVKSVAEIAAFWVPLHSPDANKDKHWKKKRSKIVVVKVSFSTRVADCEVPNPTNSDRAEL